VGAAQPSGESACLCRGDLVRDAAMTKLRSRYPRGYSGVMGATEIRRENPTRVVEESSVPILGFWADHPLDDVPDSQRSFAYV